MASGFKRESVAIRGLLENEPKKDLLKEKTSGKKKYFHNGADDHSESNYPST